MAGYGYRSSTAYSSPQTDGWGKTSHASEHGHDSEHVCRPVIVDAEGRKRPIVSFAPTQNSEYYVTRITETVVQEQILPPYASEMKQPPIWSPEGHGVVEEKWQKHPNQVDEYVTKVQTEASRPKFGPMSASTWRQTAKPSGYGSEFNDYNNDLKKPTSNGYRNEVYDDNNYGTYGNNNHNSNGWNKPSSSNISTTTTYYKEPSSPVVAHAPHYRHVEVDPVLIDTYDIRETTPTEASMITHGGWARPTTTAWATPPNSNISKPTSDISTAIGILKEVAKPFISTAPAQGTWYTETIDSKEPATRYGNFGKFKSSPKPYTTDNNYTTTIDSREAARKYHGAAV